MIQFERVSKRFEDGHTAISELSLTLRRGELTVFVGPSGCGKTTSLRMINKMVTPTSGRVTIDGGDVASIPTVAHRLGIGYVIQHGGLLPHRSVQDNVAQVLRLRGVGAREARSRALDALDLVRLPRSFATRYPAALSGGEQQRVGVARALAADPPILLMDEPFSAVDPVVRRELQQELLQIQREVSKTIVFVTHDIDEALAIGDRIAVFGRAGRLLQFDTPETVLTAPASAEVATFLGQDRGYRALAFRALRREDVTPLAESGAATGPTVPLGCSLREATDAVLASATGAALVSAGSAAPGAGDRPDDSAPTIIGVITLDSLRRALAEQPAPGTAPPEVTPSHSAGVAE